MAWDLNLSLAYLSHSGESARCQAKSMWSSRSSVFLSRKVMGTCLLKFSSWQGQDFRKNVTWKQITGVLGLFLGLFQVMQSISSTIFHHRGEDLFKTADSMVTQGFHHSKICHGWRTPFIQAVWRTSWAFGRCRAVPKSFWSSKVVQTAHLTSQ